MDEKNIVYNNKITLFLERNEIWFKTVLSLAVTLAALFVSIASFNVSKHQAQLASSIAESQEREKQPFFSITNYYDNTKKQTIYVVVNTGGQIRDYSVYVSPFLHIEQYDRQWKLLSPLDTSEEQAQKQLNNAFIYLPNFYQNESQYIIENGLFAFSDIWIKHSLINYSLENKEDYNELADYYFSYLTSEHNTEEKLTHMSSRIVYYVEIIYSNYENNQIKETLWLDRSSDLVNDTGGNTILFQNNELGNCYKDAKDKKYIYTVDSLNKPLTDVIKECKSLIESLFETFEQN